jgi:tetratricopeptide (TPR) repeat protein
MDEAIHILESAQQTAPDFIPILANLGVAYSAVRRDDDALQTYLNLIDLSPGEVSFRPYLDLGRLYHKRGDDQRALEYLKRGQKLFPYTRSIRDLIKEIESK